MASASCFLRTLSLKWSRNDDRVVGKKQQFWCVTNKKCPKLMSEFSEIIFFFSSQLFFRCTTSWSLNSFLVAIQDFLDLTSKLNGKYKAVDHHHWHEDSLFACCSWWITEFPGCWRGAKAASTQCSSCNFHENRIATTSIVQTQYF